MSERSTVEGRLAAKSLTLAYDRRVVIEDLSLTIPDGQITTIIGANACGKSTLLRGLARLLAPRAGAVYLDGSLIHRLPSREVARRLGILPQMPTAPEGITVEELASRGRHPYQSFLSRWSTEDAAKTEAALRATELLDIRDRPVDELSGGQRQRAWIAMALAQDAPILLLDEPTTFLDLTHQLEVLDLMRRLNGADGRTVVMVLHDIDQAARYSDHVIAMRAGTIRYQGRPEDVITADRLADVFGLRALVYPDPLTGRPMVIPIPSDDAPRQPSVEPSAATLPT